MADPNTSATGGYLRPDAAPAPLEGQALDRFVQQFVVGITGMDGTLVRPAWQANPGNIPPAATAWAAIGISTVASDTFPVVEHDGDGEGSDHLIRYEQLRILASFYDLGSEGQADDLATLLRDGLQIPQNLEPLTLAGMGLVESGDLITVPSLFKERWLYRVDLGFTIARQVDRVYRVRNVLSAQAQLVTDDGIVVNIVAPASGQQ